MSFSRWALCRSRWNFLNECTAMILPGLDISYGESKFLGKLQSRNGWDSLNSRVFAPSVANLECFDLSFNVDLVSQHP